MAKLPFASLFFSNQFTLKVDDIEIQLFSYSPGFAGGVLGKRGTLLFLAWGTLK